MKKILSIALTLVLALSITFTPAFASDLTNSTKPKDTTIDDLKNINDPGWNEFLNESDIDSKKAVSGDFYLKVYENPDELIIDEKTYTYEEYISDVSQTRKKRAVVDGANWIKFNYSIFPSFTNSKEANVVAGFQWLKTPAYQFTDIFTVSSDGNVVMPGATDKIIVAFWPNTSAPSVVGSYSNYAYNNHKPVYVGNNDIEFNTQGISYKDYQLAGYKLADKINALPNSSSYFEYFSPADGYKTLGCPKGSLGFTINRANSNTESCKLVFTYNHRQISINFNPGVSINVNGDVSVNGFTAGLGYDTSKTSIRYNWGNFIE